MSSGLFLLPGLAHAQAGPAIILSYLLAGLLATAGMLSQAELASAMPKAGGTYFYVMRSMGPAVGTVYGLITLLALALKSAFELVGIAAFTHLLVDMDIRLIAIGFSALFILINIVGAKEAGRLQVVLVFFILAALAVFVSKSLPSVQLSHFEPFMAKGHLAVLGGAGFVFVSFGGLLKIASLAEEIKDPGRVLPLGMIISVVLIAVIYSLVIFVIVGVLDAPQLDGTLTPISDAAAVSMGDWGKVLLGLTAVMAFSSAANAGIMGASRYPLALSRDDLLPPFLGDVNERFKTPHHAILLTGLLMVGAIFLDIKVIIKAASSVLILTYIFSCLAMIIMRESKLQNYQPQFHAPLYPWVQILGIGGYVFLLIEIGAEALLVCSVLIALGFFVYWFYGRIRTEREFALMHLIARITASELNSHSLETELKEIIKERDEITKDRFDKVVERAIVLDIDRFMHVDEFFQLVADEMAEQLNVEPEVLLKSLKEREEESSTVLSPGLAIPHIVVEGDYGFEMLLARSRKGVYFSEYTPEVHAIFVLAGTRDERNFHLRALSAIAQIVQDAHFDKKWLKARSKEALRDIVLLGERRRHPRL